MQQINERKCDRVIGFKCWCGLRSLTARDRSVGRRLCSIRCARIESKVSLHFSSQLSQFQWHILQTCSYTVQNALQRYWAVLTSVNARNNFCALKGLFGLINFIHKMRSEQIKDYKFFTRSIILVHIKMPFTIKFSFTALSVYVNYFDTFIQ